MTTISIHMPEQAGSTGQTIYLRKTSDGTLLNTDGDALTESPAGSGRFTADVAESWSETLAAVVKSSGGLAVRDGWLAVGSTIVVDTFPVPESVASLQADLIAMITGGGTETPQWTADSLALGPSGGSVAEALEQYFETDTRASGDLSILQTLEIVAAAVAGKSSASGATETYKYLDGTTDAFVVTFDSDNYRSSVAIAD